MSVCPKGLVFGKRVPVMKGHTVRVFILWHSSAFPLCNMCSKRQKAIMKRHEVSESIFELHDIVRLNKSLHHIL